MRRRKFLETVSTAGLASLAGCSGSPGDRETSSQSSAEALEQAENLERLLEEEEVLEAEDTKLFVGNPNHYDFGYSQLTASDRSGQSFIEDRVEEGMSPGRIWTEAAEAQDATRAELLDSNFPDRLEYDILVEEDFNVLVADSTDHGYISEAATGATSRMEQLLDADAEIYWESTREFTVDELKRIGASNPDTLVYHVVDRSGNGAGITGQNHNIALLNARLAEQSSDPVEAMSNIFLHEGLHSAANMPHLPYGDANLMSVSTESPVDAELKPQARRMIERYASADIEFDAYTEDGTAKLEATFTPSQTVEGGGEFLEQNTRNVLESISFDYSGWDIQAFENTVEMERDGVNVILEPGPRNGYESVEVQG